MTKLYLAVDNCFAGKRWVTPESWATILSEIGIRYAEASADVELDPLHMEPTYLKRWEQQMRLATEKTGVSVANFFSGHGTYATTGLLHPDEGVRRRLRNQWIGEAARRAGRFGAGLGFFIHAVPQEDLESPEAFKLRREELLDELALVAQLGASVPELRDMSVEQMYTPHQPPWRIGETVDLLSEVYRRSGGNPLYITLDVGHAGPQRRFLKPSREAVLQAVRGNGKDEAVWAGSPALHRKFALLADDPNRGAEEIAEAYLTELEKQGYLFASPEDADPYAWLRRLGPYSPIIHLQQSDGVSSKHLPFTAATKECGIIEPKRVIEELAAGLRETAPGEGLPEPVEKIYLTLELFTPTAAYPREALRELEESVTAWREVLPEDGVSIEELV